MLDTKFLIAVIIIILLIGVIVGIVFGKPQFDNYIKQKQTEAQIVAVNAIIQLVNQNGFVVLGDDNSNITLIKYQGGNNGQTSTNN